jgi:hypothetical protein
VCHPALEAAVEQQPPVLVSQGQGLHPVHEGASFVSACSGGGNLHGGGGGSRCPVDVEAREGGGGVSEPGSGKVTGDVDRESPA